MVKRMVMQFTGSTGRLRISRPGVDVDTASPQQLMLDERVLYAQIVISAFKPRSGAITETVSVTIPDFGFKPYVSVFPVTPSGICKPSSYWVIGAGGSSPLIEVFQPNNTTLQFYWPSYSTVTGVFYQVYRIPRD